VIARVNEAFVPLAARAPLVNGMQEAGNADEKRLYARLRRVMLAPQGIGVLDAEGRLAGDTVRQESYVQDPFVIDAETQRAIADAARGKGRVRLPDAFGRLLALNAYLGHIDVRPLENPRKGAGELTRCEMWGTMEEGTVRVEGETEVHGSLAGGGGHEHAVTLAWKGYLDVEGERVTGLVLMGEGKERLRFDAEGHSADAEEGEETFLPAGRPVDIDTRVWYGLIGWPITAEEAVTPVEDRGVKLQKKMKAIGEGIQRWQSEGKDPSPIGRIMERFEPLANAGKIDEAEQVLDEALRAIEEEK